MQREVERGVSRLTLGVADRWLSGTHVRLTHVLERGKMCDLPAPLRGVGMRTAAMDRGD